MNDTDSAKATATNFEIGIEGNYNCNSKNVVYLLECKCGKQYIGETGDFRKRMNNHRSQCTRNPDTATYAHRLDTNHTFLEYKITIIKGEFKDDNHRKKFEKFAIDKFVVFRNGLNLKPGYDT
jgi:predicted GIY-YIG superfamily endonuclease